MDIFEYLPQLIVAYDGNDKFANLIHVKKADKEKDYFCPCCGGIVKPRALDSNKEQSHYYHKTGKCTKESQLHFFCKNWLFESGSKFYIGEELFEVASIDIEKIFHTSFGDYRPDVTVHTTNNKIIYFEMFFTNRKTGDDYFCKWDELGNDVVEVNIKEYMFKTDTDTIPYFSYLYHDGICYSKPYIKRDLYANTIARIKRELTRQKVLNYKARIEQLDWFWQEIRNNSREGILDIISKMEYEDMVSCYEIIKRKQCVSYLKNDILNVINQKVISDVRKSLDLPTDDKDIYFDLKHIRGRTYEAGIRLNIKTNHITYNDFYKHCNCWNFDKASEYPKIVFSKNIFNSNEIVIPEDKIDELKRIFDETVEYKQKILDYENSIAKLERATYKIKVKNNRHTVLSKIHSDNFEVILDYCISELNIDNLSKEIQYSIKEIQSKEFLEEIKNNEKYTHMISELKKYNDNFDYTVDIGFKHIKKYGLYFKLYLGNYCFYNCTLEPNYEDFIKKINECINAIDNLDKAYSIIINLVKKINNCKNGIWEAKFSFDYDRYIKIKIDQNIILNTFYYTREYLTLYDFETLTESEIISKLESKMRLVLKNMEKYGCRVMEVK